MANMKVKVVMERGRARVQCLETGAWVRFPNNLRAVGAIFEVEELLDGKGGSAVATGQIRPVNQIAREVMETPLW